MTAASQLTNLTIGWGTHHQSCCPHLLIGIRITGSPNTDINVVLSSSRATVDLSWHSCPHCPTNICEVGSPNISVNGLPKHRKFDLVNEFCGIGHTITGSPNCFVNSL